MKKNMVVLGGTGKTGRKVAEKLAEMDYDVRIGSRKSIPSFDWDNEADWPALLEGIDAVYITFQPDLAVPGAVEKIESFTTAAINRGVKKLVLLSGKGEAEAQRAEEVIKRSGVEWTIVRASWFNQNFSESFFLEPLLAGHMALPKADEPIPFIDTEDIADVAVAALTNDIHSGNVYELTGQQQFTLRQATKKIAEATGREIQFTEVTIDEYGEAMKDAGVPDDFVWLVSYLFREILVPENSIITNDVKRVLGREARSFDDYVRETAATGVWNAEPVVENEV